MTNPITNWSQDMQIVNSGGDALFVRIELYDFVEESAITVNGHPIFVGIVTYQQILEWLTIKKSLQIEYLNGKLNENEKMQKALEKLNQLQQAASQAIVQELTTGDENGTPVVEL